MLFRSVGRLFRDGMFSALEGNVGHVIDMALQVDHLEVAAIVIFGHIPIATIGATTKFFITFMLFTSWIIVLFPCVQRGLRFSVRWIDDIVQPQDTIDPACDDETVACGGHNLYNEVMGQE